MVLTVSFVLAPETGLVVSVFGSDAEASMPEISASGYLVPAFRSSRTVAAFTFANFRK
jgi:hypothetical protein